MDDEPTPDEWLTWKIIACCALNPLMHGSACEQTAKEYAQRRVAACEAERDLARTQRDELRVTLRSALADNAELMELREVLRHVRQEDTASGCGRSEVTA